MLKKILFSILVVVLAVVGWTVPLQAQSAPTITTLSAAVSASATRISVTSATGFTASTATQDYIAYIDEEAMKITAISGTTITVQRGVGSGLQTAHVSGEYVITGAKGSVSGGSVAGGPFVLNTPIGACTRSTIATLPLINTRTGEWANCFGGNWTVQRGINDIQPTFTKYCTVDVTSLVTLTTTGLNVGTNSTPVSGSVYYGSLEIPKTMIFTGITSLNGAVAATDKLIYALYAADGTLLNNTPVAGTVASSPNTFQAIAFASTYLVTGPARYWIGVQTNGNTTRIATIPGTGLSLLGSSMTGTFATIPNLTSSVVTLPSALPTSLVTNTAPIACVY